MIHRLLQSHLSHINKSVIGQLLRKYSDAVLREIFFFFLISGYCQNNHWCEREESRKQVWAEEAFELQNSSTGNSGAEMTTQHHPRLS